MNVVDIMVIMYMVKAWKVLMEAKVTVKDDA